MKKKERMKKKNSSRKAGFKKRDIKRGKISGKGGSGGVNRERNEKDILNGLHCTMQHSMQVEENVQGRKFTGDIGVN